LNAAAEATRAVQWNTTVPMVAFMYASMIVALAIFGYGIWRKVRIWRLGKPLVRWDQPGRRLLLVLARGVGHTSLLQERVPGIMHALIFFGFLVLFAATVVVAIDDDLGIPIMRGYFYLYFESLTANLFGVVMLIGLAVAGYRRYVRHLPRLEHGQRADAAILATFVLILLTGYMLQGLRIVATHDPWALWSPIGYGIGLVLAAILGGEAALLGAHAAIWMIHVALWHSLLAWFPFSKMLHVVTSPANIFFGNLTEARGVVPVTDFEREPASLGVSSVFDLTWKQLLDQDACTECGRCQDACPAFAEGKPLSPKRVILDLRDHVRARKGDLLAAGAARAKGDSARFGEIVGGLPLLAGSVISAETLWSCTTCRACEEACPIAIEHVPLILQLRQNLAMDQAAVPDGVADLVQSLEARQHPFRGATADRTGWYQDLPVEELAQVEDPAKIEVLFWVGCAGATDPRAQKVARSMVKIMTHAGVRFAVLGPEEQCCGDPARRTGNEFHYDLLARANVETLQRYQVGRIVAHCPHCLQTLRHEYRQLGGDFEVIHHSDFVRELIASGRLVLRAPLGQTVTFHDPCYLGRYNRDFDAPRDVLDALGMKRLEMARTRERSFCCGAGGGHAFYEDKSGGRVNQNRAREALATGAQTLATACPFCLVMLEDGVKNVQTDGEPIRVRDFVELVAEAIGE
jgi:Fe-S oxidoreductase/nitrate reductase gamma subunit